MLLNIFRLIKDILLEMYLSAFPNKIGHVIQAIII